MQSYYDQSAPEEAFTALTTRNDSSAADKSSALPSVSFSSEGHVQELQEQSGIYMISTASVGQGGHGSQANAKLLVSKSVATTAAGPQKAGKRLIFQLDDQKSGTINLEAKVYQTFHLNTLLISNFYTLLHFTLCGFSIPSTHNQLHRNTITLGIINKPATQQVELDTGKEYDP